MGHLWLFSPTFFLLVWDVKDIVQGSAEHWLSVFVDWCFQCRSSFLSVLYQRYGLTEPKTQESPEGPNSEKSESELNIH